MSAHHVAGEVVCWLAAVALGAALLRWLEGWWLLALWAATLAAGTAMVAAAARLADMQDTPRPDEHEGGV